MGVDTTVYTIHGIRIPYDDKLTDILYERDSLNEYYIADGMNGEYIIIGAILTSFDQYSEGFEEIDISSFGDRRAKVIRKFKEEMPELVQRIDTEWSLFSFIHFA